MTLDLNAIAALLVLSAFLLVALSHDDDVHLRRALEVRAHSFEIEEEA